MKRLHLCDSTIGFMTLTLLGFALVILAAIICVALGIAPERVRFAAAGWLGGILVVSLAYYFYWRLTIDTL